MSKSEHIFLKKSTEKSFDLSHRKTIKFNMSKYDEAFERGKLQFNNLEQAKQIVAESKQKAIGNFKKYLLEFEKNFIKNGGEVIWALNSNQAVDEILKIITQNNGKLVVKSKSMTTEEIELNSALEKHGIEVMETDLGEFIVQVAGEKPYHIVTPAMHKSKEDVSKLFFDKFNTPIESTPQEITEFVRQKLRQKFLTADIGISGGNFLIADVGAIALTENEGNALLSVSMPKIHIAIVGIEKIIPSINDLNYIWPVLATHGTGQNISAYNSIISGPKKATEADGPEKMYVILLDNGRSDLYNTELYSALNCIRCGACLNNCPIYKNIGGYTYETTYSGPIGSIISPHYNGFEELKHLSFACTVCGKCTEVCPAKIDLHNLLLINRRNAVNQGFDKLAWKKGMNFYKRTLLSRKKMDRYNGNLKNFAFLFVKSIWGKQRALPKFSKHSFSKQWTKNKTKNQ